MTIACSKFKLHHFCCAHPKWSVLLVCTIAETECNSANLSLFVQMLGRNFTKDVECYQVQWSDSANSATHESRENRCFDHVWSSFCQFQKSIWNLMNPTFEDWKKTFFHQEEFSVKSAQNLFIVHSKKTEPWQPQLVGWYERRPLHDPNKVLAYWSKKKTTTFGAKTIVLFKNLGTGCCSQPLPSEHRCVWPLKVLLSCNLAFSGFVAVIFQGGVVG